MDAGTGKMHTLIDVFITVRARPAMITSTSVPCYEILQGLYACHNN